MPSGPAPARESALLTDLYQLAMADAYCQHGMEGEAVFEFFVRRLPPHRGFLVAAGLEQALDYLESLKFDAQELEWLESTRMFSPALLERLTSFRFSGSVQAIPEGTIVFAGEPLLRLTAPLPEAQIVETRLINIVQFQTMVASKAARCVLAARGGRVIDFGLRRAHGAEAGLLASRACHIAGFAGTSNVLAARLFGIPAVGTMAHSFVQAHEHEEEAFERFARARRSGLVLLIDTNDTADGARKVARLKDRLAEIGAELRGVRIDGGDLASEAKKVRGILDEAGLGSVRIVVSGGLDESEIGALVSSGAPVDTFAVGTKVAVSADAPYLDCAYKLVEYDGRPTRKRSAGKATFPGRKQVFRVFSAEGKMAQDTIALEDEGGPGLAVSREFMRDGRRSAEEESLARIRERAAESFSTLPDHLRALGTSPAYLVLLSEGVRRLAARLDEEDA